jgi:hypothetical protein
MVQLLRMIDCRLSECVDGNDFLTESINTTWNFCTLDMEGLQGG